MFLIPLIAFPFILAAAAYRLYTLPRRYLAGTLRLTKPGLSWRTGLTAAAYLGLLSYMAALAVLAAEVLAQGQFNLDTLLHVGPTLAGFPVAYVAAEWVFYYGFQRPARSAGGAQSS